MALAIAPPTAGWLMAAAMGSRTIAFWLIGLSHFSPQDKFAIFRGEKLTEGCFYAGFLDRIFYYEDFYCGCFSSPHIHSIHKERKRTKKKETTAIILWNLYY